ncbi:aspartyl aminopeptidase [Anaeramoeba flamelloides]|uniref:aspartyl aminopeptidase n=1 Tax=Anaeramoeba flamelloides TaxID=1746091 RepID=A0ABQ8XRM7_9EUKA|nr:aspartyl aminopeptidase [Anaeramoeba flamelloides]
MSEELAQNFVDFVNKSPTQYHATTELAKMFSSNGFTQLHEKEAWSESLEKGKSYFITRNSSAIIAFSLGGNYKSENGFTIVGAHTDSPGLRVKPISKKQTQGSIQIAVSTYGGGLWYTWFDRDLTIAGRVLVKKDNKVKQELIHIKKPIMNIPNLAIHLNRGVNSKGFTPNTENHLIPILSTEISEALNKTPKTTNKDHHPLLLSIVAKELKIDIEQIVDFELSIVPYEAAVIGGQFSEFIYSPRLDNLMSSYAGAMGIIEGALNTDGLEKDTMARVFVAFDNEEIGSSTLCGARSNFLKSIIKRITYNFINEEKTKKSEVFNIALRNSFLMSADNAHAVHPNYSSYHESRHQCKMNAGPVFKTNLNGKYTTQVVSGFIIKEIARFNKIPVQDFVVRNDSGCGSTIGPALSTQLGLNAIDIGVPQWGMHSIRETAGTLDLFYIMKLFVYFYNQYSQVSATIEELD